MLRDLTIQNYRTFKDFHIDGLARVNLIVGMNNTGKTSLLEAIYLLVNQGRIQCLLDVLNSRGEISVERTTPPPTAASSATLLRNREVLRPNILHIFYRYQLNSNQIITIECQKDEPLLFQIQPHSIPQQLQLFENSEYIETDVSAFELVFSYGHNIENKFLVSSNGGLRLQSSQLRNISQSELSLSLKSPSLFLTTNNLTFEQLAVLWDDISLTPKEDRVIEALQILEQEVERISFSSHQTSKSGVRVKLQGISNPIPLGIMGDGMRRILTLAMAAVTVENGFLLIDEIDTGLHYQTQTDMWRLVIEVAKQLNVQVFATTHSWDCITAFQEALAQSEDSSVGKLFRLSRQEENIRAVEYTPDELSIAVRQSIEVR